MESPSRFSTDAALWNAFRAGDMAAFEQIYRMHSRNLLAYGKRLCADHDQVQDAVQDVFMEIWKRRATLCELNTIRFYLFRVLRNRLMKQISGHTDPLLHPQELGDEPESELLSVPSIDFFLTEQETTQHVQQQLRHSIQSLPHRQREALTLAFYDQLSNAEIAGIMHINTQSVTNHISRALLTLRGLMTSVLGMLLLFLRFDTAHFLLE